MQRLLDDRYETLEPTGESLAKQRAAYMTLALASLAVAPLSIWLLIASRTPMEAAAFAAIGLASLAGAIGGTGALLHTYEQRFWKMPGTWMMCLSFWTSLFAIVGIDLPQLTGVFIAISGLLIAGSLWSNCSRVGLVAGSFTFAAQVIFSVFAFAAVFVLLALRSGGTHVPYDGSSAEHAERGE